MIRSIRKRATGFTSRCPNCGSTMGTVVDTKFVVTRLVECAKCYLLYRTPTDSELENNRFYQGEYEQGMTTEVPSEQMLKSLLDRNDTSVSPESAQYLELLYSLGFGGGTRVLDFGCSWGYGTYQFQKAGMIVEGLELCQARAAYARDKLGLRVSSDVEEVSAEFDVFFSSHVLEHVASLRDTLSLARRLTKPGGVFVGLTPNGSAEFRVANHEMFHHWWGLSHPNLLQAKFARGAFAVEPLFLGSAPYPLAAISRWDQASRIETDLSGWELLIIAVL